MLQQEKTLFPISRLITNPDGVKWDFIEDFIGSIDEAHARCDELELNDPSPNVEYHIWDDSRS